MSTTRTDGRKVAVVLMKSEEADATIDVLQADRPAVRIADHGTYWLLEADDEIRVDMNRVGEELGRELTLSQWLVVMSSFVGRAAPGADYFRVTSDMLELGDLAKEAPAGQDS
jgi:hypothetical protein